MSRVKILLGLLGEVQPNDAKRILSALIREFMPTRGFGVMVRLISSDSNLVQHLDSSLQTMVENFVDGCILKNRCPGSYSRSDLEELSKMCFVESIGTRREICNRILIEQRNMVGLVVKRAYDVETEGCLLAHNFLDKKTQKPTISDFSEWLMSEKFDGVRAIWDGDSLRSRSGKVINPPSWWSDTLPVNESLDGELISSAGFENTVGITHRKKPIDKDWKTMVYYVFDSPAPNGPFIERHARAIVLVEKASEHLKIVKHFPAKDRPSLDHFFDQVIARGGEGVMLRKLDSLYFGKRNKCLLKHKPLFDAEAKILGFQLGKNRNANRLGAFEVEDLITGHKFRIGTGLTDELRDNYKSTHPIGTIVTYAYAGLTNSGKPRQPRYLRKRD